MGVILAIASKFAVNKKKFWRIRKEIFDDDVFIKKLWQVEKPLWGKKLATSPAIISEQKPEILHWKNRHIFGKLGADRTK